MTGTPDKPETYQDWKIINGIVRKKIAKLNRSVFLNYQGRCFNNRTKEEYNPEDLVRLFGVTPVKAQSYFMSFTQ